MAGHRVARGTRHDPLQPPVQEGSVALSGLDKIYSVVNLSEIIFKRPVDATAPTKGLCLNKLRGDKEL
jgi:hypothetical protein